MSPELMRAERDVDVGSGLPEKPAHNDSSLESDR